MTTRSGEVRDAREGDGITIDQEDEGKMTRPNALFVLYRVLGTTKGRDHSIAEGE